jgi:hypothetical protein
MRRWLFGISFLLSAACLLGTHAIAASITIAPGSSPAGGYLPLSLFGTGDIGAGDETITNFAVPAFQWAGQSYSNLGVVSIWLSSAGMVGAMPM